MCCSMQEMPDSQHSVMGAETRGVNVTDVSVTYIPPSHRDRAAIMVLLRPGKYPTDEAAKAISLFIEAITALMNVKDL